MTATDHASWADHDPKTPIIDLNAAPSEQMISDSTLRATIDVSASTTRNWRNPKKYDPPLKHEYLPGVGIRYRVGHIRAFFKEHAERARSRFKTSGDATAFKSDEDAA